jgi:hypothetical protein
MGQFLKAIGRFAVSVVTQVAAYMTGGVVAAGVFVYEHYSGKNIPMDAVILGVVAFFVVACFLAWKKEFDGGTKLQERLNQAITHDAASLHTTLEVALYQTDRDRIRTHRIGVRNDGSAVAKNVKVRLLNISPTPSESEMFRNDFPYRVVKDDATWSRFHSTIPYEDANINPHEEEHFRIAISYPWQDGFLIKDLDTKKNGDSYGLYTARGKEWLLIYEIMSENAAPVSFSLTAIAKSQDVIISRKS